VANTAVKVSSSPNHLTYLLTGDGTVIGPTIANATIVADMPENGPLWAAWNRTYGNQAAMRTALLGGGAECEVSIQLVATGVDVTAERNQVTIDTDTDAVTATKAEINVGMSVTTGQLAFLHIKHRHSVIQ